MNKLLNISKGAGRRLSAVALVLVAGLLGAGSAWAGKGYWSDNAWNIKYYDGTDKWYSDGIGMSYTPDLGVVTTLYFKGAWVRTWRNDDWTVDNLNIHYWLNDNDRANYTIYTSDTDKFSEWDGDNNGKNQSWTYIGWDDNLISAGTVGENTVHLQYWLDSYSSADSYFKFTIPGFSGGSSSINVGNVARGGSGTASLASAYTHYGTALTTGNCSITGTNSTMFSVTSISETNVTVQFAPPAGTALGSKSATLTITDAHGKTKSISLSGTAISEDNPVVLIADTAHISDGPSVVLQGYLKKTGCVDNISRYGFKYASTCASVESGTDVYSTVASPMKQGALYSKTISSGLSENTTYYYKTYVYSSTNGTVYNDGDCGTFTTRKGCTYADTDTIYYTIDASAAANDDCSLIYSTFEAALTNLRTRTSSPTDWWNSSAKLLKKHVVFQVAPGSYGTSGSWIDFSEINYYNSSSETTPTKYFIVRPLKVSTKPIVYGMRLANSRYVTVDGMNIKRTDTAKGMNHSAILVGLDSESNNQTVGVMADARIKFVNCQIEGKNFSSIHANGIDGFYMENCNLVAAGDDDTTADTFNWGASIKFMNSKNIILLRNNFKGAHANNIFAQNVRNMLVMNNVFWNDNAVKRTSSSDNYKSVIRLINYGASDKDHKIQNIGIYYNTMYIADNTASGYDEAVNFLTLGGNASGDPYQSKDYTYYDFSTIDFMYNNCYSYDQDISGRPTGNYDAFKDQDVSSSTHLANNNFWSQYDTDHSSDKSGFAFGSGADFVNVKDQVCKTAPNTPEGLVVKGTGLNRGSHLTSEVAGASYASDDIDATEIYDDRLKFEIRPRNSDPWTLGAYQQALPHEIDVIIWNGADSSDPSWDNRNNWVKPNGQLVTCADILSDDLQVIIPAPNSENYPLPASGSISTYPTIPEWDDEDIPEEGVRIGSPDKFANNIELEYGAALLGTENLANPSPVRYAEATAYMEAGRSEWILVGNMVKPFTDDTKTATRNIKSGDYFIENQEPHVYMQHVVQNGTSVKNGATFTSLETAVSNQSAYMIRIPDEYGLYKLPAEIYYSRIKKDASKVGDKDVPKTFTFNGRFAADGGLPSYTGLKNDGESFNFVSNYYTANLDIYNVLQDNSGWGAKYYDYDNKSWVSVAEDGIYIKPQAGFILVGDGNSTVTPAANRYVSGSTAYKSADASDLVKISLSNTFDGSGSVIYVKGNNSRATKAFGMNASTPELYMIDGDEYLDVLSVTEEGKRIPLGVRNSSGGLFTVQFRLERLSGFDNIVLEDAKNNTLYDLTEEQPVFNALATGDIVGRFFLNVGYAEEKQDVTDVREQTGDADSSSISVFAQRERLTVSASADSRIERIVVSDMSGRSWILTPEGTNYSVHTLPVENGVYTVTVITDKATKNQKIIIKR